MRTQFLIYSFLSLIFIILLISTEYILFLSKKSQDTSQSFMPYESIIQQGMARYPILNEHPPLAKKIAFPGKADFINYPEYKPYELNTDENGLLIHDYNQKNPDKKIFFLGSSIVEDRYIDQNLRTTALISKTISEKHNLIYNTYNAAVSGTNSYNSLMVTLTKAIPLSVDYLVFQNNINDLRQLMYYKEIWMLPNLQQRWDLKKVEEKVSFYRKVITTIDLFFPNIMSTVREIYYNPETKQNNQNDWWAFSPPEVNLLTEPNELVSRYKKQIHAFIGLSRAYGIEPILATQASRLTTQISDPVLNKQISPLFRDSKSLTYSQFQQLFELFNNEIRQIANEQNIILVDFDRYIPKTSDYMYDLFHYTPRGAEMAASIFVDSLSKSINP